jgi:hypothetical protein
LEIDTFLDEDSGHGYQVLVRAEVLALDVVVVAAETILGAPDNTEIWICLLGEPKWNLHASEFLEVGWVLHLLQDHALLHLPDVLLLNNSE